MNNDKKPNVFEKFFSIDEFKMSSLVLILFIIIIMSLVWLFLHGVIPTQLVDLASSLIYSIAGVNIIGGISSSLINKNTDNGIGSENTGSGITNNIGNNNEIPTIDPNSLPKI